MITRKQIEEILDETLEGDNPVDSAPTVLGKEECANRLMELVKNCSIPVIGQSEQLKCDNCKCTPTVIHNTPSGRFCEACRPVTL